MESRPARIPGRLRLWSLSEHVLVETASGADRLVALTRWGEIKIDGVGPVIYECLRRMSFGPVSLDNLPIPGEDLSRRLDRLGCCIVQSLGLDDEAGPLLSVVPVTRDAVLWRPAEIGRDRPVRLSRFAAILPGDGNLLLESPVSAYRVVLHRPRAAWVVSALATATDVRQLAGQVGMAEPVIADILSYLTAGGMVLAGSRDESGHIRFAEDDDPSLIPWSQHDLQFHARSRMSRDSAESGALYPLAGRLPAAPAVKPLPDGPRFPLYRPVLGDLAASDPSLTEAIETRRTHCDFGEPPLSADQLGELLFRVARVRWTKLVSNSDDSDARHDYVVSGRPYPSTSDLYELELYVSTDRCTGLPRGSFHYDPRGHALTLVNDSPTELAELLDTAKIASGSAHWPPVLITMTTRIARLSWMYSGIAYSLTLRHVGELQQTMYLVATAMGLASCAPAVVESTADEALRLDWPDEVSVGEFIVGFRT